MTSSGRDPHDRPPRCQRARPDRRSPAIVAAVRAVAATHRRRRRSARICSTPSAVLRWVQAQLAAMEPELIAAARRGRRRPGRRWRRRSAWPAVRPPNAATCGSSRPPPISRAAPATAGSGPNGTAGPGDRAVARWANDNTADLRRLAGQVAGLTDLDESAAADIGRLHRGAGRAGRQRAARAPGRRPAAPRRPPGPGRPDRQGHRAHRPGARQTQRRRERATQAGGADEDAAAR